ncbi:putative RING-H2 finger protein ATL71 [Juglans microcarpa x Juglans regia]|uniref:putative RING-H2 finger protein ATL71 n=1 Tax=Juglans microcarpa x Juglans regia TaxID=2249226 RepID=UPI001B7F7199|nr:putative RING-H2 finger protein ATL71 [Juglans microcarpa x Juglans regia]
MDMITGSMMGYCVHDDFRFAIVFPLGIILLLILLSYLVYFFGTRLYPSASHRLSQTGRSPQNLDQQGAVFVAIKVGLDEAILHNFPKLLYAQYILQNSSSGASSSCCICLDDYKESDVLLTLLPDCGHLFHPNCIHPWLRMHPNCPLCRNTLVPVPNTSLSRAD